MEAENPKKLAKHNSNRSLRCSKQTRDNFTEGARSIQEGATFTHDEQLNFRARENFYPLFLCSVPT